MAERNASPAGSVSAIVTSVAVSLPRFESVTVNVIVSPTLGRASSTTFSTFRSAYFGVSVTLSVLLFGLGSYWFEVRTLAVLVCGCGVPEDGGSTIAWIVSVRAKAVSTVPTSQTPVPTVYVPWLGWADTNCRPAGT